MIGWLELHDLGKKKCPLDPTTEWALTGGWASRQTPAGLSRSSDILSKTSQPGGHVEDSPRETPVWAELFQDWGFLPLTRMPTHYSGVGFIKRLSNHGLWRASIINSHVRLDAAH